LQALDFTAAAWPDRLPLPAEAVHLMATNPLRLVPFALWRWLCMFLAAKSFEQQAALNGISKQKMLARTYAA
jgi:hypothetical protein